ncbi:hypothetical protein BS47DRAFT_203890 [Hydnum rufescens UP504]|uniref:Uncharacterized protein n=1 Tax=Hydnum rufescens UP504 TaxID=1448309 RepID=A0A9P6DSQ6_9AGAM|nr:hypothetical protein BS47DRAFT_203890 [Hydnum rufescens UP504]
MSANCGAADNGKPTWQKLRIGAVFIILVTSLCGTLFPIISRRKWKIPILAFEFIKYFGSGVIIATAFIHLLAPAFAELGAACVTGTWQTYPFASAFAMASVFGLFFLELFAVRLGTKLLAGAGLGHDTHDGHAPHIQPEIPAVSQDNADVEKRASAFLSSAEDLAPPIIKDSEVMAQIVGIAILEFGVIFHSIIIGITLAVNTDFRTLFVVIVFHQMFEGLGLGSRLAYLALTPKYSWVPYAGAIAYSVMTPIGIAVGLGVRSTYNPDSARANIVTGTLDSISAGILLYTGLVELLAHEFLFNSKMQNASTFKIAYANCCMLLGAGIMALLGRWA